MVLRVIPRILLCVIYNCWCSFHHHAEQVSLSNAEFNHKPQFEMHPSWNLCPDVDFYVQTANGSNEHRGRWKGEERGSEGGGGERKADWGQRSGTDGVRERAEENEQRKYKSLNQKNKKFIRIGQSEGEDK